MPDEQDLNVPRCLFEGALGIDIFQGLPLRTQFLGEVLQGTAPKAMPRERIESGRAEGRFDELVGEIDQAERGAPAGLRVHV